MAELMHLNGTVGIKLIFLMPKATTVTIPTVSVSHLTH